MVKNQCWSTLCSSPRRWTTVKFEDFILKQDDTLKQLEAFLGFSLVKIEARPDSVGRWKTDKGVHDFPFLSEHLKSYGYVDLDAKPRRKRAAS